MTRKRSRSAPPLALVGAEGEVPVERPPDRASLSSAVRPIRAGAWTLQVTLDGARKEKVERLQALLSHRIPDGDVNALFGYMLDCTLENVGKERGAVRPSNRCRGLAASGTHPSRGPPGGVGAGRRAVHLRLAGREAVRESLAARAPLHRTGREHWLHRQGPGYPLQAS
jgi:hypothetical protein